LAICTHHARIKATMSTQPPRRARHPATPTARAGVKVKRAPYVQSGEHIAATLDDLVEALGQAAAELKL
jgi:hypothetical protein